MPARPWIVFGFCLFPGLLAAENGVVAVCGQNGVPQTVDRLDTVRADSNASITAGTELRAEEAEPPVAAPPARIVVFENPLLGERLRAPAVALDSHHACSSGKTRRASSGSAANDRAPHRRHGTRSCDSAVEARAAPAQCHRPRSPPESVLDQPANGVNLKPPRRERA